MSALVLSFLGPPEVVLDGRPVDIRRRKVLALLAYLAVNGGTHLRDALAELLYPDHEREQGYSDLRQTLSVLRSQIGADWILSDRDTVSLRQDESLCFDVRTLRQLVALGHQTEVSIVRAAGLIRGPFLAGFYLKDSTGFEDWQTATAEETRRDEMWVLERLADLREQQGDSNAAIHAAHRLLELDSLDEHAHRRLMALYNAAGKRSAALGQYERCRALLAQELNEAPSRETEELRGEIARGEIPSRMGGQAERTRVADPFPTVGRDAELRLIDAAGARSTAGTGSLLVAVGVAGIGKTRLLRRAGEIAAERGALVIWAHCTEDASRYHYWPWRHVLTQLGRSLPPEDLRGHAGASAAVLAGFADELRLPLGDPPPAAALGSDASERFRLFEALTGFLTSVGDTRRLILVVDDLHWCDTGSLRLLEFISRKVHETRLLLLAACRDGAQAPGCSRALSELSRIESFRRIDLGPLDRAAVERLVETSGVAPSCLEGLMERTGGNALFVAEVLRFLQTSPEAAKGPTIPLPPSVRAAIRRRLEDLDPECRGLLETAAAVGTVFSLELVGCVEGRECRELLPALDRAEQASFVSTVSERPGVFRFSHPLVQDAVLAEITGARAAETHHRIALGLERLHGPDNARHAAEVAWHLGRAGPLAPVSLLVRYSLLAGEQALAAYEREDAREHFERGLAAKGPEADDADVAWLRFGVARTLARLEFQGLAFEPQTSRPGAFWNLRAAYRFFERIGDTTSALRVALQPLVAVWEAADKPEGLFERALPLASPGSLEEDRLLWLKSVVDHYRTYDHNAARTAGARALRAARARGDRHFEIRVLASWSGWACEVEPWETANEIVRQGLMSLREIDDPLAEADMRFRSYHLALASGDLPAAIEYARDFGTLSTRLHSELYSKLSCLVALELAWIRGDWKSLREASDRAFSVESDTPQYRQHLLWRAWFEAETGEMATSDLYLTRYLPELYRVGIGANLDSAIASLGLSYLSRITGDARIAATARAAGEAWVPRGHELDAGAGFGTLYHAQRGLALATCLQGDREAASRHRDALARLRGMDPTGFAVIRTRLLGLLDLTLQDYDAAVRHFEQGLAAYRAQKGPNVAWTQSELAEALISRHRVGDPRRAADLLSLAGETARRLGMRPLAHRIRRLLAQTPSSV